MLRVIGRLLPYILRYWPRLLASLTLALCAAALELVRPWPVKIVVDYVLAGRPLPPALLEIAARFSLPTTREGLLTAAVAVAAFSVIGAALLSLAAVSVSIDLAQRLVFDLSRDLFRRLQRLSLSFHQRHPVGDLLQRVSGDVFVVHFLVSEIAIPVAVSVVGLGGMLLILSRMDSSLTLIALAVVPLLALWLALFSRPLNQTAAQQYAAQGSLMSLVEQSLSAIKAIQGFAREPFIQRRLEQQADRLGTAYRRSTLTGAAYKEIVTLTTGVAASLLLWLGGLRALRADLSAGDLLVFLGYLTALYGPVNALTQAVGYAVAVAARGSRVVEILDATDEVPERADAITLERTNGEIVFDNVRFGYGDQQSARPVLDGISFRVAPGQVVAVVGATGAGKSSLVSLLSRFYDPWEGAVRLDGRDVREIGLTSLREQIALVLQEPFLFPVSVLENIGFGRPNATRAQIIAAAQIARAHEFIERLPDGYETVLGEKGASLSGGERQRIAIARAVVKDAPILILDEPTSALDAHTESLIFDALSELIQGKTTFIISHRLSTIRRADQILALENGRIVEQGTHETLLAREAVYSQLYRHQHIAAL